MRPVNRVQPSGPPQSYKTYGVLAPPSTHWRQASCAEVDCAAYQHGWRTTVDTDTVLGQQQAAYIRAASGRRFTELRDGATVTFTFEAGQPCFKAGEHRVRLDRPEVYVVKDGDWRRSTNVRRHARAADWLEDFATHQDRLADHLRRG